MTKLGSENIYLLLNDLIRNRQYWFLVELHSEVLAQCWVGVVWLGCAENRYTEDKWQNISLFVSSVNLKESILKNLLNCHRLMAKCRLPDDRQDVCVPCVQSGSNAGTLRALRDHSVKFNFRSVCDCCVLVTAKRRLGNYERQHWQVRVTYRLLRYMVTSDIFFFFPYFISIFVFLVPHILFPTYLSSLYIFWFLFISVFPSFLSFFMSLSCHRLFLFIIFSSLILFFFSSVLSSFFHRRSISPSTPLPLHFPLMYHKNNETAS